MCLSDLDQEIKLGQVRSKYPVLVSNRLQQCCLKSDGVARQFQPSISELETTAEENSDPIGDATHSPVKGIVHRYPNRLLLIPTVKCPSYCRFCFRKARVGHEANLTREEVVTALDYIRTQEKVEEVILSGGEPFSLTNELLQFLFESLDQMSHVKVIRIHTRIQLTGDEQALQKLMQLNWPLKQVFVVVHCNHSDEIDARFTDFISAFKENRATVLSQSVLLKGVNDSTTILSQLFCTLAQQGVIPYYLHHPDLVKGAGHFRVSLRRGMELMKTLQGNSSGYAIPKYVLDIPGGLGKVPVNSDWIVLVSGSRYEIRSPFGGKITYFDCN